MIEKRILTDLNNWNSFINNSYAISSDKTLFDIFGYIEKIWNRKTFWKTFYSMIEMHDWQTWLLETFKIIFFIMIQFKRHDCMKFILRKTHLTKIKFILTDFYCMKLLQRMKILKNIFLWSKFSLTNFAACNYCIAHFYHGKTFDRLSWVKLFISDITQYDSHSYIEKIEIHLFNVREAIWQIWVQLMTYIYFNYT